MGLASDGYRILQEDGPLAAVTQGARFVARTLRAVWYGLGSGRRCLLCGYTGRRFLSAGDPPRPEAQCPDCGARERHRLLWHYITTQTALLDGGHRVLQFAPTSRILDGLRRAGTRVTTVDLRMDGIDVHADITRLPFDPASFDTVVCSHVLEHVPDDRAAMAELYRVLAPGGEALILVPKDTEREETREDPSITDPETRRQRFGQADHVRWYGRDIRDRLADAGFAVSVETPAAALDAEGVDRYGLRVYDRKLGRVLYDDVHHCRKPEA